MMARMKHMARKSTGGKAPKRNLVTKAVGESDPMVGDMDSEPPMDVKSPGTPIATNGFMAHIHNNEPPTSNEQPNTSGKKSSIVWENFTLETVGDGSMGARCKMCKRVMAYSSRIGTSHLKRHILLGRCPGLRKGPPKECHVATTELESNLHDQDFCTDEGAKVGEKRKAGTEADPGITSQLEEEECAGSPEMTTMQPTVFGTSSTTEKQPEGDEVTVCGSSNPALMKIQPSNSVPPSEAKSHSVTPAPNGTVPASIRESSVSVQPPLSVQIQSRNLIEELSSRTVTQRSTDEISTSSQARHSDFLRQQKEKLAVFLNMSLEEIHHSNCFDNVEKVVLSLVKHTTDYLDRTILEALESRLAEFRESIPSTISALESAQTHKDSLQKIAGDLDTTQTRLVQMKERLGSLEAEVSRLSEEERKLEIEIQHLIDQKEEVCARKSSIILQLDKINEEAAKDLEEWRNQEDELKQAGKNWVKGQEKLAQANASWQLFRDYLRL